MANTDDGTGSERKSLWRKFRASPLARVGPGLITGVADDDPGGIATYSQAGAQYGFNMLWIMPLAFPLVSAVQSMCARIGRVTGKGLAANLKDAYPPMVGQIVVLLLVFANTLNIGADVAAMGEVAELVTGIDRHIGTAGFVFVILGLLVFMPYHRYVEILKWLTLSLLAYAAVLFTVKVQWSEVAQRMVMPQFRMDAGAAAVIVGVFGTTISPYLFFWQASEEVEEMQTPPVSVRLIDEPTSTDAQNELTRINWDTWSGMFYANLSAAFIMLATAVTLNATGTMDIQTAAQAANALRPIAGHFAFLLFALGILGVGMIGVPVLAGSAAYGVAETFGWKWGLERKLTDARGFYGVAAFAMLAGLALQYSPINPMKALFWSAVINGIVAVPLVVVIVLLSGRRSVMGTFVAHPVLRLLGLTAAVVMAAATVRMFWPG